MSYCIIILIVCTLSDVYMAMSIVTMFYANKVFVLYCIYILYFKERRRRPVMSVSDKHVC